MKQIIVVKAGGELMASQKVRAKILADVKKLAGTHHVIFVHGGGPQIEAELTSRSIPSKFINGRRFTSDKAIGVIEQVLSGEINKSIAAELSKLKAKAVGLSGRDGNMVLAKPIPKLGRAGKPIKINTDVIKAVHRAGFVPIISSIGSDEKGRAININADDMASALACKMAAHHLILLTNISGVLDHMKNRIPILKTGDIQNLIDSSVITGGMIPKIQSAHLAILKGVGEVDIVNGFYGVSFEHGTRIIPS